MEHVIGLPSDGRDVVGKIIGPERRAWPTEHWFDPAPLIAQGVTKLRIRGHGNNVMPHASWADAAVSVDEPRIDVQLEGDMTIHCGATRALIVGEGSAGTGPRPIALHVESGDKGGVLIKGRPHDELGGKWAFDSYQHTGRLVGLVLDSETCVGDGHARYGRGSRDLKVVDCFVRAAHKEAWKEVGRGNDSMWESEDQHTKHTPYGTPWPGMPQWRFDGVVLRRFALSHSESDPTKHFGGGFIFQPNAGFTTLEGCIVDDRYDSGTMLLGTTDGTTLGGPGGTPVEEAWAYRHPKRGHPAGGPLIATRCGFHAPKRAGNGPRILVDDCVGTAFVECGLDLHPDARIEIRSPAFPAVP